MRLYTAICPSAAEWESVLRAAEDDPRAGELVAHADGCPACQRLLARLAAAQPEFSAAVRGCPPEPFAHVTCPHGWSQRKC
jgi:hypothetical protein